MPVGFSDHSQLPYTPVSPPVSAVVLSAMSRRGKETQKLPSSAIQDGARAPRAAARPSNIQATDAGGGSLAKLAQYARTSPVHNPKQDPQQRGMHMELTVEEGSAMAATPDTAMQVSVANPQQVVNDDASAHDDFQSEPTLRDVLLAVNQCNTSLSSLTLQMGNLKEDIGLIRQNIQRITERTTAVETRVSDLEDQSGVLQKDTRRHTQQITTLMAKVDDLENRSRRNNIRMVGIPEKVEGANPTEYFEGWLRNTFGKDILSPLFAVERAHRVPMRPLPPGAPPRSVLVKVLHYRDRDIILRKARELSDVRMNGSRIAFYPDFSADLQKRRAQFQDVKRRLRTLDLSYAMLYPAKLRVVAGDTTVFFENPKDAAGWLDRTEPSLRRRTTDNA